jgi:hypothetical protein
MKERDKTMTEDDGDIDICSLSTLFYSTILLEYSGGGGGGGNCPSKNTKGPSQSAKVPCGKVRVRGFTRGQ